ncbi:MAG: lipoprotein [Proteobacteria bacterium]|nr:lipoprotein [Pseudomonadota bacterium]MDE3207726.1 lipoprotein [Pseudomonadota bacterium]
MRWCYFILTLVLLLQGCGIKGPLYLPGSQPKPAPTQQDNQS